MKPTSKEEATFPTVVPYCRQQSRLLQEIGFIRLPVGVKMAGCSQAETELNAVITVRKRQNADTIQSAEESCRAWEAAYSEGLRR